MLRSGKAVLKTVLFLSFCFVLAITGAVEALAAAKPEPAQIEIAVQSRIVGHEYNGEQYYLAFDIKNAFEFTLSPIDGSPIPENNKLVAGEIIAGNSESDLASFDEIIIDKEGEYKYTVRETDKSGDFPYFTFDAAEHEITVQVVEHEGKLEASVDYGTPEADYLVIENKYEAYDLEVFCKSIGGSDYDEYSIAISFYDGNDRLDPYTYTYIQNDGTEIKSETGTSGKTVTLKNGEGVVIPALPKGSNYSVEGKEKEGYRIAYDVNRNGSDIQSNINTVVTFADENLSCTLEIPARVQLYGHNESVEKYYYPGITTVFPLQLEAITPNAPMPGGAASPYMARRWGFNVLKGTGNQYRSILGDFGEIVFTEEDLLINPSGVFKYKVTRTREEYSFIEYDFRDNYEAPEYTITVELKRENGKLVAVFIEDIPLFRHRFVCSSMRIKNRIMSIDNTRQLKSPIELAIFGEDDRLLFAGWNLIVGYGRYEEPARLTGYTIDYYDCLTIDQEGKAVLNLSDHEFAVVFNLVDGMQYHIKEDKLPAFDSIYWGNLVYKNGHRGESSKDLVDGRIDSSNRMIDIQFIMKQKDVSFVQYFSIPNTVFIDGDLPFEISIEDIKPQNAEICWHWTILDESIACFNDGLILPRNYGETVLRLQDEYSGLTEETVIHVIPSITGVTLSPFADTEDMIPYETGQIIAYVTAGSEEYNTEEYDSGLVEFRSSNENVLTVSCDGYIRAKSPGSAVVTARTRNGMESSKEITVRSAKIFRIPSSVKRIEEGAFSKTNAEIYILPESIDYISDTAFESIKDARFIVVPITMKKEIIKKLWSFNANVIDENGCLID